MSFPEVTNIRTYVAGIGSGGAMLGAALAAFVALVAIVGVNGLPTSSADSKSDAILVSNAPEIAAASSVGPRAAPAATPAPGAAAAAAAGGGAGGSGGTAGGTGGGTNNGGGERLRYGACQPSPTSPAASATATTAARRPRPRRHRHRRRAAQATSSNVVNQVDQAVTDATGVNLDLSGKTSGVTGAVDDAVGGVTGGKGLGLGQVDVPDLPRVINLGGGN